VGVYSEEEAAGTGYREPCTSGQPPYSPDREGDTMAMTFREFMDSQAALLTAFANDWIEKNKEDPEQYPMLMEDGDEGLWDEQLSNFAEAREEFDE
jgi:hypothetical protein